MNKTIDINCDMGEWDHIDDASFMPFISSCNVCCGAHAGSDLKIDQTIEKALEHNLKIGAHPSYPDRENFGRKSMKMNLLDFQNSISSQIENIILKVEHYNGKLRYVKAHGALYNDLILNETLARTFIEIVKSFDKNLKILGFAGSGMKELAYAAGLEYVSEVFMDRKYLNKMALVSRVNDTAVFRNYSQVEEQVKLLLEGKVDTQQEDVVPIKWSSLCVHSDTNNALQYCQEIHAFLLKQGYAIS